MAKQANAFILAPLQDHVPSFVLAVGPVFKGQDYTLIRHWYNQAILWGARNESEVLLTAIEEHCTSSSNALIDLVAAACLHQSEQVESEEEDEDSPTHCALYKENKCKYNNSTFKPLKKTHCG